MALSHDPLAWAAASARPAPGPEGGIPAAGTAATDPGATGGAWPTGTRVDVWAVDLDLAPSVVDKLSAWLPAGEQVRADRFNHPRARRDYLVSRAALRAILAAYVGARPSDLIFASGPWGKPALAGAAGQSGLEFNVSHAQNLALVAVSAGRPLGVDLEHLRPIPGAKRLAERFFSPPERAALAEAPHADEAQRTFLRCWTRKEAYVKALGVGVFHDLDGIAVSCRAGEAPALLWCRADPEAPRRWSLAAPEVAPGYVAALAAEGPLSVALQTWIPPSLP